MKKLNPWQLAILYFLLFGLLSIGFLKIDPSPFELAKVSFGSFWALLIFLACIFLSFGIGVMQGIEQLVIWFHQAKLRKGE